MATLTLIIKKKFFDQILSGEKDKEFREIRPRNASRYCEFESDGTLIGPKKYDQIQFWVGYEPNRPGAVVEIKNSEITLFNDEETGEPITYVEDGIEYIEAEIMYELGSIVSKQNC